MKESYRIILTVYLKEMSHERADEFARILQDTLYDADYENEVEGIDRTIITSEEQ